jgi:hypothetical protein
MLNNNNEYGRLDDDWLQKNIIHGRQVLFGVSYISQPTKDFKSFSAYLKTKNAWIIHAVSENEKYDFTYENNSVYYTPKFVVDNYGNIYNVGQTGIRGTCKGEDYIFCPEINDGIKLHTFEEMHPYSVYRTILSNSSIDIIKKFKLYKTGELEVIIKNLKLKEKNEYKIESKSLQNNLETKQNNLDEISILKEKIEKQQKQIDELIKNQQIINEKHNELVNK